MTTGMSEGIQTLTYPRQLSVLASLEFSASTRRFIVDTDASDSGMKVLLTVLGRYRHGHDWQWDVE